ncbi:MAG: YihY/virulence factor BrkB family protein [Prevotellaceae bacterium]|nr:YihY/virulence factor BrkB family protein [Prevotellaceae bacterium]MDY6130700.1 YihY/virulence factor BrkB family protein [Prevotella sp.]
MSTKYKSFFKFLKTDIWQIKRQDVSPWRYLLYEIVKKVLLAIEWFTEKGMINSASALTYSTLLAIVPILAVVFAIARGFGYNKYIETWFRDSLSSQPQVADAIVGFVNSYLVHTKGGVFLGVGLLFMLWTVIMLISNIEKTFNNIWQVKKPRNIYRTITDYMALILLVPIIIVVTSGISIMMATFTDRIAEYELLGTTVKLLISLSPYVIMSGVFIALYVFMPNTKVKITNAILPGILSGVAMQGLQLFYIHSQIWVSSYNAIYGSFAALPLFMLWVQISWTICLFGAELSYTSQNLEKFAFRAKTEDLSHRYRLMLSLYMMSLICKRFRDGRKPYTALDLKLETNIPIRITHDLLFDLTRIGLLTEVTSDEKSEESVYQPALTLEKLTAGMLIDRLEAEGRWKLDINMHQMESEAWRKIRKFRTEYLDLQRSVAISDL